MKSHARMWMLAVYLLAALAITIQLTAQDNPAPKPKHHQYKLYDFGTFGGPGSYGSYFAVTLTAAGAVGSSDTPLADPFTHCFYADCFVKDAVLWRQGKVTNLGALPGNSGKNSSFSFAINNAGLVVGISENGATDPATGYPEVDAVIWQDGNIVNLGTFGGTQGNGYMVNNRGQVVGNALNAVPDPYSFGGWFPGTTQSRAFLWERGVMRDLGTLGGPDASAPINSDSGKIAGTSYTNNIPNPTTGIPTIHPFLYDKGQMIDLGTWGGTLATVWNVNNKGQVVGYSFLPGDQNWKGFIWDKGVLTPASLGGHGSYLGWLNEAGDAAGGSFLPDEQTVHTTLWKKGQVSDIGAVGQDTCAQAYSINASQQVVGVSVDTCAHFPNGRAFLWENGGPMVDLNSLIENLSGLRVYIGLYITDSGQIYGQAVDSNSNNHTVVLIPDGDCNSNCEQRIGEFANRIPDPVQPSGNVPAQFGGVPGMGRFNPLARLLEAHRPNANPAQPN